MKKLTDKDKLEIIESMKLKMEEGYEERKNLTEDEIQSELKKQEEPTVIIPDEFNEIDKAWILEIFNHYGVNVEFY